MGCGCGKPKMQRQYTVQNASGQTVQVVDVETQPPRKNGQSQAAKVVRSAPVPSFNRSAHL